MQTSSLDELDVFIASLQYQITRMLRIFDLSHIVMKFEKNDPFQQYVLKSNYVGKLSNSTEVSVSSYDVSNTPHIHLNLFGITLHHALNEFNDKMIKRYAFTVVAAYYNSPTLERFESLIKMTDKYFTELMLQYPAELQLITNVRHLQSTALYENHQMEIEYSHFGAKTIKTAQFRWNVKNEIEIVGQKGRILHTLKSNTPGDYLLMCYELIKPDVLTGLKEYLLS